MNGNGYTPTEKRIMDLLFDGRRHHRDELLACLLDDLATYQNLKPHLSNIRRKLKTDGLDIVCILRERRIHYQLIKLFR